MVCQAIPFYRQGKHIKIAFALAGQSRPIPPAPSLHRRRPFGQAGRGRKREKLVVLRAIFARKTTNKKPALAPLARAGARVSSGSGLDPDISPAAAYYQAGRVARVRVLDVTRVNNLIAQHTQGRHFGFLGEERVNVLELNLALDQLQ
jgi:K+-transporting ATPase KdpC subunit